jgi:hypothetical protein
MVRPPKGTGEQIRSNLVMNAIEVTSKVGDQPRELVRNALDPSGKAIQAITGMVSMMSRSCLSGLRTSETRDKQ